MFFGVFFWEVSITKKIIFQKNKVSDGAESGGSKDGIKKISFMY
jgi:hypothetical protein